MYFLSLLLFFGLFGHATLAQSTYWQQEASYTMDINFDVKKHQFEGDQKIQYINHSPDQLDKVFYHLYKKIEHHAAHTPRKRVRCGSDIFTLVTLNATCQSSLNDTKFGHILF